MATGVVSWSKTAATNASADSAVNFAEGQAPSSVNDSARGLMASVAKYRDDLSGITTGGTSTAYTVTSNQGFASLTALDGMEITIIPHTTSGASPTLSVDGLTAKSIRFADGIAPATGALKAKTPYKLRYVNADNQFLVANFPAALPADFVATANIADDAITLAKLVNATAQGKFLVRHTASSGDFEEGSFGAGLNLDSSTGVLTAPAFPTQAAFKNLVVKVASNTTVTVTADFVVTTDGTNYRTTAVSSTINLGTTGADALDTGTIASSTWYAIHVVTKPDGTTKCVASTSATSPTMPGGYDGKARVAWVRTASGSAQLLGTWQFGRKAQYVPGLAQSSNLPNINNGAAGTFSSQSPSWSSTSVSSVVPSTASEINIVWTNNWGNNSIASICVAPNNSYAGQSSTNPPPFSTGGVAGTSGSGQISIVLEGTSIYWASSGTGAGISCQGWVDNI